MRESKLTLAVICGVVLLLGAYVFMFQVRVNEVAVHYRPPGKVKRVINAQEELAPEKGGPGLYFRLPYPIDDVRRYDKRIRVIDGPLAQTQLKDDWQAIISMYCAWHIKSPVDFEESLGGSVKRARQRLEEIIFNETSKAVSDLTFHDLVSTDGKKVRKHFDRLERDVTEGVESSATDYGLQIDDFGVRRIAIPQSTTREVFKRMRAERKKVAQTYIDEGKSEKTAIIASAREEANKILTDARKKAKRIRSEGEAAEAKYYDQFARQPELAIFLRRLEALRTIAKKAREAGRPITFVLDPSTEPFSVLSRGAEGLKPLKPGDGAGSGKKAVSGKNTDDRGDE